MKLYTNMLTPQAAMAMQRRSAEHVRLNFDDRKRGRLKIRTENGVSAGIQIERGHVLRDGSWLKSETDDLLQVLALPEAVTTAYVTDATLLARACYHLGNRHVPLQVGEGFLRYQCDYVLDEMLIGLGLELKPEQAPFEPENGAYAQVAGHSHGDHREHERSHEHKKPDCHSH